MAEKQVDSPQIHGESAFLLDVQSGQVLYSKNPDQRMAPASTTKIMTALLVFEHGNLNDIVTASSTMLDNKKVYGTEIYLSPGEQIPLNELLYAVLLNSANDAAVAVAEHIGGDLPHFVDMMNERAEQIGMSNTHFLNSTGLTENGHYTTAHDLALLARVAYLNPLFLNYTETKTHPITRSAPDVPANMVNENKLLWQDPNVNGMKTGYTAQAGNCIVASASREGRSLIGVILKSPGKEMFSDMDKMLNYGFDYFTTSVYKPAGEIMSTITVRQQPVNLILSKPIYTSSRNGDESINLHLVISDVPDLQEIKEGQHIGKVQVWEGTELLNTVELLADRSIQPQPQRLNNMFDKLFLISCMGLLFLGIYLTLLKQQISIFRKSRTSQQYRRETNS